MAGTRKPSENHRSAAPSTSAATHSNGMAASSNRRPGPYRTSNPSRRPALECSDSPLRMSCTTDGSRDDGMSV